MTKQLEYDIFLGNLAEFVGWWNKKSEYKYNGAMRIVYMKEREGDAHTPMPTVEYILQDVR